MIQQCVVCLEQKWPIEGRPLHVGKALQSSLAASSPHRSTKLLLLPFVLFSFHASISSQIAKENKNEHEPAGTLALNQYKKSQNSLGKKGLGMCPCGFADACHICLKCLNQIVLLVLQEEIPCHLDDPTSKSCKRSGFSMFTGLFLFAHACMRVYESESCMPKSQWNCFVIQFQRISNGKLRKKLAATLWRRSHRTPLSSDICQGLACKQTNSAGCSYILETWEFQKRRHSGWWKFIATLLTKNVNRKRKKLNKTRGQNYGIRIHALTYLIKWEPTQTNHIIHEPIDELFANAFSHGASHAVFLL